MALDNVRCTTPQERQELTERLGELWNRRPDLRFGELLTLAFALHVKGLDAKPQNAAEASLYFIHDRSLLHAVEDFVGWAKVCEVETDEKVEDAMTDVLNVVNDFGAIESP